MSQLRSECHVERAGARWTLGGGPPELEQPATVGEDDLRYQTTVETGRLDDMARRRQARRLPTMLIRRQHRPRRPAPTSDLPATGKPPDEPSRAPM